MLKTLAQTSSFLLLLKRFLAIYDSLEQRSFQVCLDSKTYNLILRLWDKIKSYFRYSFLGNISHIEGRDNTVILNDSKFVQGLLRRLQFMNSKLKVFLKMSLFLKYKEIIKDNLHFLPIKSLSIAISIAIAVNIFLSTLFAKEISFYRWYMQYLFLFISINGLFCNASWEEIKRTSLFLKYFNEQQKSL